MNCANHPDLPVSAYCQNCGKPLCTQCMRSVAGVVYCEPCLAARLNPAAAYGAGSGAAAGTANTGTASTAGWNQVPGSGAVPPQMPVTPLTPQFGPGAPSPVLAGFLGVIPGVGAMYNGQFVKAFAHVIIFVVLISISDHLNAVGILVAAWFFYQVFDAVQTAIARREGRPLPDPFGLDDLGQRLGVPGSGTYVPTVPVGYGPASQPAWTSASGSPAGAPPEAAPRSGEPFVGEAGVPPVAGAPDWDAYANRVAAAHAEAATGVPFTAAEYSQAGAPPPVPPVVMPPLAYVGRPEPIGAIVLIAVGVLFLLSTLGVFEWHWIGHGWPVLIIALGAWLLFRRMRTTPTAGGGL